MSFWDTKSNMEDGRLWPWWGELDPYSRTALALSVATFPKESPVNVSTWTRQHVTLVRGLCVLPAHSWRLPRLHHASAPLRESTRYINHWPDCALYHMCVTVCGTSHCARFHSAVGISFVAARRPRHPTLIPRKRIHRSFGFGKPLFMSVLKR